MGRLAEDRGELEQAEALLSEALALFNQLGSPETAKTSRNLERVRKKRKGQQEE
ncbi:MAG: hypothetical protein QME81_20660 [bacterium]|nr:hypothetical protein [bacterium]